MEQTQADILSDLRELGDPISQYTYLIECAAECVEFGEELHVPENLVRDCAVNTWLCVEERDGWLMLVGDSESLIVRGAIALLEEIYNGRSIAEIELFQCSLLDEDVFRRHFSPKQRRGLASAIERAHQMMLAANTN